jgi:hypothetical protein
MMVSLSDQLQSVRREIALRKRVYPRWIASGKMTPELATREIAAMEAVERTIAELAKGEELAL